MPIRLKLQDYCGLCALNSEALNYRKHEENILQLEICQIS
jgi:hypothetical protein